MRPKPASKTGRLELRLFRQPHRRPDGIRKINLRYDLHREPGSAGSLSLLLQLADAVIVCGVDIAVGGLEIAIQRVTGNKLDNQIDAASIGGGISSRGLGRADLSKKDLFRAKLPGQGRKADTRRSLHLM